MGAQAGSSKGQGLELAPLEMALQGLSLQSRAPSAPQGRLPLGRQDTRDMESWVLIPSRRMPVFVLGSSH